MGNTASAVSGLYEGFKGLSGAFETGMLSLVTAQRQKDSKKNVTSAVSKIGDAVLGLDEDGAGIKGVFLDIGESVKTKFSNINKTIRNSFNDIKTASPQSRLLLKKQAVC